MYRIQLDKKMIFRSLWRVEEKLCILIMNENEKEKEEQDRKLSKDEELGRGLQRTYYKEEE